LRWLKKKLLIVVLTVLVGGLAGATLVRFAPGYGVDERELDVRLNQASIEALRREQSRENLLVFYFHYLRRMLRGDLGYSTAFERPVAELISERLPTTLESVALGLVLAWLLGLPLAILVVLCRAPAVSALAGLIAASVLCLPMALIALGFFLMRAPAQLAIGVIVFPKVFRYAEQLLMRAMRQDYVLLARAKGLSELRLLFQQVLPALAPQLLALAGVSLSLAFSAAIPVEVFCGLAGIAQLAWQAATARDLYLLINLTMILTAITLVANSASGLLQQERAR
jgi:peptide/nickel transport system permease protein